MSLQSIKQFVLVSCHHVLCVQMEYGPANLHLLYPQYVRMEYEPAGTPWALNTIWLSFAPQMHRKQSISRETFSMYYLDTGQNTAYTSFCHGLRMVENLIILGSQHNGLKSYIYALVFLIFLFFFGC